MNTLIHWHHNSPEGGHSGRKLTLRRLKQIFYLKAMTNTISQFVRNCITFQEAKNETIANLGLLQPLQIPEEVLCRQLHRFYLWLAQVLW